MFSKTRNVHLRRYSSGALRLFVFKRMASKPLILQLQPNVSHSFRTFTCHLNPFFVSKKMHQEAPHPSMTRRIGSVVAVALVLVGGEAICGDKIANGFDFNLVAPGLSTEEAEHEIRGHTKALLQIKDLIETESWGEAQKVLRKSSSFLKQELYAIIQGKPGSERPQLRKLYSTLFNNVTRLDYAARDRDASRVQRCYENIVTALDDILSKI